MYYLRKNAGSNKEQHNATRNQRGSSGQNNQSENQPLYSSLFSKRQNEEDHSKTKVLRPPGLRTPNLKECTKVTRSQQSRILPKKQETVEEKKNRLKQELSNFESPFIWRPQQVKPVHDPETILYRMQEKDREVIDERKFKWRNFIFHVVISYELWRAKKLSQAFEEICGLESVLVKPSSRCDYMFTCIEDALWHVVTTSKAFLYLEQDLVTKAEELMCKIQPVDTMRCKSQAGIHGIRAAVFMEYGHGGNKNALEEAWKAVKLDRTGAEWQFFISKCMGRIRRVAYCHEPVDPLEVRAINRAIKLDQSNATYIVFLAQVLSERAFREFKKDHPDRKSDQYLKIRKTNRAAMHLFKKAAELSPNSPHILIRCARGQMKLPPSLKDLPFTKECIDKALELAPNNPMVHHVKAMYHERYDCDAELPLQAYEKAASLGNFGAAIDLVRLHHELKRGDIIEELETLATIYEQVDKLQVVYAQAGSYLLFIKKDIIGALNYYLKAIDIDPKSYAMMSHKPIFFRMKNPVNMFDVLLEELGTKTDWISFSPEDKAVLRTFEIKTMEHKPLPTEEKIRPTVEEILLMSRKAVEHDDLYEETKKLGRTRRFKNWLKGKAKRWRGKKKSEATTNKENVTAYKDCEKLQPKGEIRKYDRQHIKTKIEAKRRDSISSVSTVDSDYHRDSTVFGPRRYCHRGSSESLCSTKSDMFGSHTQDNSLNYDRLPSDQGSSLDHSRRASRDSSISSLSSRCSGTQFVSRQDGQMMYPDRGQLTVENLKTFDIDESYDTGIRRLSKLSLSSSVSPASSTDTLSVMDRVKKSYAMLGRNSEPTKGGKKHLQKHRSTQSLFSQKDDEWKKDLGTKNIPKYGSSVSLNVLEENIESKFSKGINSGFRSKDSSTESRRSYSFMPAFARKNSESDMEKS